MPGLLNSRTISAILTWVIHVGTLRQNDACTKLLTTRWYGIILKQTMGSTRTYENEMDMALTVALGPICRLRMVRQYKRFNF